MQNQVYDGCTSILVIIFSSLAGFGGPECKFAPFKMWVTVTLGYYIFNVGFVYCYYKRLQRTRRESIHFLLFNCFLCVLHSCWLIYGNVIFWKDGNA